jgi:pimeloyl-ACP methyl ester carboxylesterase
VPAKYQTIGDVATLVYHRGPTTLPGAPPDVTVGKPVLCIHDAGGNGNGFAELLEALEPSQSPIAFDLPGHGRSAGLDSLGSIDAMAGHAQVLAESFGLGSVVLVGEGMGAAVALELAAQHPSLTAGLVLIGGAAAAFDVADEVAGLAEITAGRARREFDRSGYAPDTDRSVYQRAFADWVKTDPRATLGDRRGQADWSLGDRAATVTAPVLVVIGEHEEANSASAATALAGSLANGSVETLGGAGRRGVLEQPGELASMINRFVEAL